MNPTAPVALREPANLVSPNAVRMWRIMAWLTVAVIVLIAVVLWLVLPSWPWWATAIALVAIASEIPYAIWMPKIRYRVHRWEITDEAVHTRSGWLSVERRVAPLNRVQTVDSSQGPVMRRFGVSSVTVTTASAAGPITIEGLDDDVARQVVAELTTVTAAVDGDAT